MISRDIDLIISTIEIILICVYLQASEVPLSLARFIILSCYVEHVHILGGRMIRRLRHKHFVKGLRLSSEFEYLICDYRILPNNGIRCFSKVRSDLLSLKLRF